MLDELSSHAARVVQSFDEAVDRRDRIDRPDVGIGVFVLQDLADVAFRVVGRAAGEEVREDPLASHRLVRGEADCDHRVELRRDPLRHVQREVNDAGADAARGIRSRIIHFTLDMAERITPQLYAMIAVGFPANQAMAGEWVFSHLLPGGTADDPEGYVREILQNEDPDSYIGPVDPITAVDGFIEGLHYARGVAAEFVQHCARTLIDTGAPVSI